MRVEVLHQYEGHASIGRRIGEERLESGEPTGRGANAHDKAVKQEIVREGFGRHWCCILGERNPTAVAPWSLMYLKEVKAGQPAWHIAGECLLAQRT
jgi:hypothetical protein